MMFTYKEKLLYAIKRHSIGMSFTLAALLMLSIIGNIIFLTDSMNLLFSGLLRAGFFTTALLLVSKFVFPKFNIQERIKDDPVALAIFCGLLFVAYSNLF